MYTHVIYHKACADGFGSAYCAHRKLGNNSKYIPLAYYDIIPKIRNSNILVCDFSFDYETTLKYINDNKLFFNIDHHKSAYENLLKLDDKYKKFDMNHSGAYLTWEYFFPDENVPLFIKLIEDYDLWKFNYEETKPFMLALNEICFNFREWAKLENEDYVHLLIEKGKILQQYQNNTIETMIKSVKIKKQTIGENEYNIGYCNTK